MPFINVKLIEGVFDAAQRREIVEKSTMPSSASEGENMRPVTWCGDTLTATDVKNLRRRARRGVTPNEPGRGAPPEGAPRPGTT